MQETRLRHLVKEHFVPEFENTDRIRHDTEGFCTAERKWKNPRNVSLRLELEEYQALRLAAAKVNMCLSDYIRQYLGTMFQELGL